MKHRNVTASLIGCCLCGSALADPPGRKADAPPLPAPTPDALDRRIEQVEWDGAAFQEVVAWLRGQGVGNVVVKWRALEIIGADATTPITLSLQNVPVRTVLREALAELGGDEAETDPLKFHLVDGLLTISTRSEFNRHLLTRVYDVTDLIQQAPDFRDGPVLDLDDAGGGQGGRGADGAPRGRGQGGGEDPTGPGPGGGQGGQELAGPLENLINLIKATIEPDTWEIGGNPLWSRAAGGGRGTIVPYRRMLVVRNTLEVHEQIGRVLR